MTDAKQVPLKVRIMSVVFALMMAPVVLFVFVFCLPPIWTVLIVGYMVGKSIGKRRAK